MAGNLLLGLPGFSCRKCYNFVARSVNIVRTKDEWIIFSKCINVKEAVGDDHKWNEDYRSSSVFVCSRSDAVSILCCSCSEAIGWRIVEAFDKDFDVEKDNVLLMKAKIFSNVAASDCNNSVLMPDPRDSSAVKTANAAMVTGSLILTAEGSDIEKKVHRVPVQRTEEEKRYSRAVSSTSRPGASKRVEELKRFGEGKKKARHAEFAPGVAKTDLNDQRKAPRANICSNTVEGDIYPLFAKLEMGNPGQPSNDLVNPAIGNLNKALDPPNFQTPSTTVESPKETDGLKTTIAGVVRASSVTPAAVSVIEKKISRAKRFGISVQLTEKEKRDYRAERFGEGKKKARHAEFAPWQSPRANTCSNTGEGDIEPLFAKLEMGNPGLPSTVGIPGQPSDDLVNPAIGNLNKALDPTYFQTPCTTVETPKETDGLKTTIAGVVMASSVTPAAVSVIEKKMSRAKRFGIPVQLTEKEKRDYRAERFGTASGAISSSASGSESLKKLELKREATVETSEEEVKKKARSCQNGSP